MRKVQIQDITLKNLFSKELKAKKLKPANIKVGKFLKQGKKDKKRRTRKHRQNNIGEQNKQISVPDDSNTNTSKKIGVTSIRPLVLNIIKKVTIPILV